MKDFSDLLGLAIIGVLIVLCAGEPDLLDSIIKWVDRQ